MTYLTMRESEAIEDAVDAALEDPAQINLVCNEMTGQDNADFCAALVRVVSNGHGLHRDAATAELRHVIQRVARKMHTRIKLDEKRRISREAPDGDDYEERKLAERESAEPKHYASLAEMQGRRL